MSRLIVCLRNDSKLLFRHNLVHATVFMTTFWIVLMFILIHFEGTGAMRAFIPLMLLTDTATIGFYFCAGLVFFEKDQNVLKGLVVTPVKPIEYIFSKTLSLSLLTVFSGISITIYATWGMGINLFWTIIGVLMIAIFYTLVSFISVTRFDNIIKYIFTSVLYFLFFNLPLLGLFGVVDDLWFIAHPVQPFLTLISAPFVGIELWQIFYSLFYGVIVIFLTYLLSKKSYMANMAGRGI